MTPDLDENGLVRWRAARPMPGGPASVAAVLGDALATVPEREALVGRSGRFTYAALDHEVAAAVCVLHDAGLHAGDRLAASLPNDVDIVVAFLAAMRLGIVWVGVNRALAPPEKAFILRDCDAVAVITTDEIARSLEPHAPDVRTTWTVDAGTSAWRDAVAAARGRRPPAVDVDPHAPAAIAYTSGTTGFPKGAVHSQHNMLWPGVNARESDPSPSDERQGVLLPLTLLNLQVLGPLFTFLKRSTCICVDRTARWASPAGCARSGSRGSRWCRPSHTTY